MSPRLETPAAARRAGKVKTALTAAEARHFREQGFVVLPGFVPRAMAEEARRSINAALSGGCAELCPGDPEPSGVTGAMEAVRDTPAISGLLRDSGLLPLAESLLGGLDPAAKPRGWIVLRYPQLERSAKGSNFHIDGVYSRDDELEASGEAHRIERGTLNTNTLKVAVYLSDLPRPDSGNFSVIPGSHLRMAEFVHKNGWEALLKGMPDLDLGRPLQITGRAGDAVLVHYLTVHDGEQNLSPDIRYAVFFDLAQVRHQSLWREALADPWLEWPGLRSR